MKDFQNLQKFSLNFFNVVVVHDNEKNSFDIADYFKTFKSNIVIDKFNNLYLNEISSLIEIIKNQIITKNDLIKTFYTSFKESQKDRFEILLDQIKHYSETYGEDFQKENFYVENPNFFQDTTAEESNELDFSAFSVIKNLILIPSITKKDFLNKLVDLIYSNVALDSKTVKDIAKIFKDSDINVDANKIKNKEFAFLLKYELEDISDVETFVRSLNYTIYGNPLLIQSNELIKDLRFFSYKIEKDKIEKITNAFIDKAKVENVAESFNRYKKVLLAIKKFVKDNDFKNDKDVIAFINKAGRLSKKLHKPMNVPLYLKLTDFSVDFETFKNQFDNLDIQYKIKVAGALKLKYEKLKENKFKSETNFPMLFKIRNGKVFIKERTLKNSNEKFEIAVKKVLYSFETIRKHIMSKVLSNNIIFENFDKIRLALPISEKQFFGNYPFGTRIPFEDNKDKIIGISWKGKEVDFDLSAFINRTKIGWNSDYSNGKVFFSGDITSAPKGATELVYVKTSKLDKNDILTFSVNLYYSCNKEDDFKFFIGDVKTYINEDTNFEKDINEIVSPEDIFFVVNDKLTEKTGKNIGFVHNNEFAIIQANVNENVASRKIDPEIEKEAIKNYLDSFVLFDDLFSEEDIIQLNEIIENKIKIFDKNSYQTEKQESKKIDFSNPSKSDLLDLILS